MTAAVSVASVQSRKKVAVTEPAAVIARCSGQRGSGRRLPIASKIAPVGTFPVSHKPFTGKAGGVECCRRPACRKPCSRRETK